MKLVVLVCLFSLLCYAESYKILVLYPLYVKSLNILGQGVVRHLLNNGHEVTYITAFPLKNPPFKNYREIDISNNSALFKDDEALTIRYALENGITHSDCSDIQELASENAKLTFLNQNVIKFMENTNEHFDAVLVDLFESEVYAGLAVLYNCPMLWVYSLGAHWQVVRLIADPGNPSYDADYFGTNIPPFSFAQRIEELWARVKWNLFKTFVIKPKERNIYEQAFGPPLAKRGRELPDYEEVIFNASMIFSNEHNAMNMKPSTPQNLKYIGGFHVEDTVIPLPKNLQDLMDSASNGVIYFSMGSFFKSKQLPTKLVREILDVFGELKETVIWKFEEDLKEKPKNVYTVKWAPQQSILAHPNCKIFITHGGFLSSIESIHFGVPIIGIPLFLDQFNNIQKAVANNYALKVDLNYDLPKNLKAVINVMLKDQTKKVKELSSIYHDIPTKPGAELAHWVRHAVRTGGALHLRSPAINVPLYQRLFLDLITVFLGILFILHKAVKKILKKDNKKVVKQKKH